MVEVKGIILLLFFNTSAVSSADGVVDAYLCKLRDIAYLASGSDNRKVRTWYWFCVIPGAVYSRGGVV